MFSPDIVPRGSVGSKHQLTKPFTFLEYIHRLFLSYGFSVPLRVVFCLFVCFLSDTHFTCFFGLMVLYSYTILTLRLHFALGCLFSHFKYQKSTDYSCQFYFPGYFSSPAIKECTGIGIKTHCTCKSFGL